MSSAGIRVPLKTGRPRCTPGLTSTSGQSDQSIDVSPNFSAGTAGVSCPTKCYTPPHMLRICAFYLFAAALLTAQPTLFQTPTVNQTHVVFAYAGDLWSVPRGGGQAQQLTSGTGVE